MSPRRKAVASGALLELWRPPTGAGDPIGCLATTYTFAPGLFDEQCLARFLEIESEPNREDLAFLLERESRLGGVYAGVLVDHSQAGVEHSLRWDVLPVRIAGGKQHAKLSLLVWQSHIRVIATSANLTEQGYRTNYEVAAALEMTPDGGNLEALQELLDFLGDLLAFVPNGAVSSPALVRARLFLRHVRRHVRNWTPDRRRASIRQHLVFSLPHQRNGPSARSTLDEAMRLCRARGGAPEEVRVASPFFDTDAGAGAVAASLCKAMARGGRRKVRLCVPALRDKDAAPRLTAPRALLDTASRYVDEVTVDLLPDRDVDKNPRVWHAKMLGLSARGYTGLMVGSANFTTAGMGVGARRNAEASLLTIADKAKDFSRHPGQLDAVWPEMERLDDPESAEWLGAQPERDEEEQSTNRPVPAGFLAATYRAGANRRIILDFDPAQLPTEWRIVTTGQEVTELLSSATWKDQGSPVNVELGWRPAQPPQMLLVSWDECEAFLPLNVEDQSALPPPVQLEHMTADDMLGILAAADPSGAYRAWAKRQQPSDVFDDDLDSAVPVDLDPLRRFDLQSTFLHRVRRRARVLAQLRANLQRPVSGRQALEWRLRGLIGIEPLAERLVRELVGANGAADEALLTLADFLIVLREVTYAPADGGLSKAEFEGIFRPFLRDLSNKVNTQIQDRRTLLSKEPMEFWTRVVERCQE